MKKFLLYALCVLTYCFANAQENALVVDNISRVPAFAQKLTPKNTTTWVFGTIPIGANKSSIAIHFFEAHTKPRKKTENAKTVGYRLNLFAPAKGKLQPKLLNTIRFAAADILYFDHLK